MLTQLVYVNAPKKSKRCCLHITTEGLYCEYMRWLTGILIVVAIPSVCAASFEITEIMYDLPGTDSKREWVEVHNVGQEDVDISEWRFYENETNHRLEPTGSGVVPAGGYAVIADDPDTFLQDNSEYTGALFGSSFSLSNEGETLILRDSEGNDVDSITYSSSSGAAGDANSLNKSGSSWVPRTPSPGESIAASAVAPKQEDEEGANHFEGGSGVASTGEVKTRIHSKESPFLESSSEEPGVVKSEAQARDSEPTNTFSFLRTRVVVGERVMFSPDTEKNTRHIWNFGDGSVSYERDPVHVYEFPGTYRVTLAVSGAKEVTSSATLVVEDAAVSIVEVQYGVDSKVTLSNSGSTDVDISGWILNMGSKRFFFPQHTYLLAAKEAAFVPRPYRILVGDGVSLALPGGQTIATYMRSVSTRAIPISSVDVQAPFEYQSTSQSAVYEQPRAVVVRSEPTARFLETVSAASGPVSVAADTQAAAVSGVSTEPGTGTSLVWIISLLILLIAGSATLILLQHSQIKVARVVDEYELLE